MARKEDSLLRKFNAYASSSVESDPILLNALRSIQQEEEERQRREQEQELLGQQEQEPLPINTAFPNAEVGPRDAGLVESILGFLNEPGMILTGLRDEGAERPLLDRTEDALRQVVRSFTPDSVERGFASAERDVAAGLARPDSTRDQVYLAQLQRQIENIPQSRENQETLQAVSEAEGLGEVLRELASNPPALLDVIGESFGRQAPALLANVAGAGAGVPAMFASSLNLERQAAIMEAATAAGIDPTDGVAMANFARNNPDQVEKALDRGTQRGAVIGTADSITMGLAGRVGGSNASRALYDYVFGTAGGMAGEAGGQLVADGGITSIGDIYLEGIAEGPTAIAEGVPASIRDSAEKGFLVGQLQNEQRRLDLLANPPLPSIDTPRSTSIEPTSAVEDLFGPVPTAPSPVQETVAVEQDMGPAPEQTSFLPPVGPEISGTAVERIQSVRSEVQKSRERAEQRRQKAAENARNKARRSFIDEQIQATSNLDSQEADSLVTRRTLDWDQQNPVENFLDLPTTQTPRARKTAARKTPARTVQTQQEVEAVTELDTPAPSTIPGRTSGEQIDALLQEAGFSSTVAQDNGTETTYSGREAIQSIIDNIGQGDARTAARILTNGNTRLVDDTSQIPADNVPTNSGAYYIPSTGQTFIVASSLRKDQPVVGQILDRAAHEHKHAGDLSANEDLRRGALSTLIGVERNEEINNRIRAAAQNNDPVAQAALSRLQNSGETGARAELELPAYFIEESRKARRNSSVVNRIGRDILSAVRTGAKQVLPGDYTVSLDDVAYLSDRLLQQAATTQQSTAASRPNMEEAGLIQRAKQGLSSIQGPLSNRYQQAVERDWTYTSMDGREKFVTSDSNSTVDRTALRSIARFNDMEGFEVSRLLKHDELFADYPQLADIPVVVDENPDGFEAGYYSATQDNPSYITVKKDVLRRAVNDPTTRDYIRGLLLHELQHGIQDIENSARGGNDTMFRTPQDRKNIIKLSQDMLPRFRRARNEALDYIGSESSDIPQANRQILSDTLVDYMDSNLSMQEVTDNLVEELSQLPEGSEGRARLQEVVDIFNEINPTRLEVAAMRNRTLRDYRDLLGEREANFTQDNRDLTIEDLPRNPEDPTEATGFAAQDSSETRPYTGQAIVREDDQLDGSQFTQASFQPETVEGLASVTEEAAPLPEVPRQQSRLQRIPDVASTLFKRALMSDGGVSNEIAEAVRFAYNSQAAEALNSNILTNHFTNRLENARIGLVETTGERLSTEEIRERLLEDLDRIDELPTRQEREAAIDALDQKYPLSKRVKEKGGQSLSKIIRDIRRAKQDYTRAIIQARRANPKPLTQKDENLIRKMLENDERYTTRAYLATYDQEVGKEYGKRLLDRAYKDTSSEEYQIVNDAMNFIVENDLVIPEMADLMRMPIERLRHMHEYWGLGNASHFKSREGKRELAERLSEKVGASRQEMEARAMLIIRDMLGQGTDETGARRRTVRTARADTTITQGRTGIPKELRRLLGEITDPVMRETITLHRMGSFITKMSLMNELYARGEGKFWSDTPTERFKNHLSESEGYGPLAGKYLDDDMFYALSSVVKNEQALDVSFAEAMRNPAAATELFSDVTMRSMRGIIGTQKFAQVVASPLNMALNLVGSPLLLMANGIVNPVTAISGMRQAASALAADVSLNAIRGDEMHNVATEMARVGALDTASVGMFQTDFFRDLQRELRAQVRRGEEPSLLRSAWEASKTGGRFTKDSLRNAYALMDVWVKVATYLDRKNFWTDINRLENMGLSDQEIQRRAGWDASTTNISYDRAIPLARSIEQNSPVGMFLTYFSEAMIRVPMMNGFQAYRDAKLAKSLTNPEAKKLATKAAVARTIGTLTATAGVISATLMALGAEDEEEKLRRNVDPEWYRNSIMIPIGTNEDGMPRYYPVNRIDPLGPLNEAVVAIFMADEDEKLDAVWDVVTDQFVFSKSIGAMWQMFTDIVADATGDDSWDQRTVRNSTGEAIKNTFPEFYNTITQLDNDGDIPENLLNLLDTFVPTGVKGFYDPDRNIVGFRPYVREAEKSMRFRIYDHNKVTSTTRREFFDYAGQRPSTAQVMAKMNSLLDREERSFQDLYDTLQGYLVSHKDAEGTQFSRSEAGKLFRDERAGNLYRDVSKGRFRSSAINEKTLKRWYDDKLKKAKDKEERKQLRDDYRMLREVYRDVMKERSSDE